MALEKDEVELDSAPSLSSGLVLATPEAVEGVVEPAGDSRSPGDRQNRESERALDPC
jgi:hypothetical protein